MWPKGKDEIADQPFLRGMHTHSQKPISGGAVAGGVLGIKSSADP